MAQRVEVDSRGGPLRLRLSNKLYKGFTNTLNSIPALLLLPPPPNPSVLPPCFFTFVPYFGLEALLPLVSFSASYSSAIGCSPLYCSRSLRCCLTFSSSPSSSSPFIALRLAFLRRRFLDADESLNLSALRTGTTDLCVGQRFKDESLSTQRLCTHAFA